MEPWKEERTVRHWIKKVRAAGYRWPPLRAPK
jgi:hypothetical protein